MEIRKRHFVAHALRAFAACLACLALCACSHDDAEEVEVPDGYVQVGFRISLSKEYGSHAPAMRADGSWLPSDYTNPDLYEVGTGYENYIGLTERDFRFLLFDENGKFVERMDVLGIYTSDGDEYATEYNVLCSLAKKPEGVFRVVALANWGAGNYPLDANLTPGVTTIDQACGSGVFAYSPSAGAPFTPSAETPIPMFGVATCNVTLQEGTTCDIGTIYLLRAMAKVEVICKEGAGLELASVTLSAHNDRGFCAPTGMESNTSYVSSPHIPANAAAIGTTALTISESKDRAVIYIPEYLNKGDAAAPCSLSVTFADNLSRSYPVEFCEYVDGKATATRFDILRNVCYRFTVDKQAEFTVDLIPYGEKWLEPVFGL